MIILLTILLVLALDRILFWHRDSPLQALPRRIIETMAVRLPSRWDGLGAALALVAPAVAAMGLVQWFVTGWMFGLVSLVLATLVLLFMLGPVDVRDTVDEYIDARRTGDLERSDFYYTRLVGEAPPLERGQSEAVRLARSLFHQGHDHLFATLFWFALLGPMGAVLYRLAAEAALCPPAAVSARPRLAEAARDVVGVLGWAPARLLGLAYALTGSFESAARDLCRGHSLQADWLKQNRRFLADVGETALGHGTMSGVDPSTVATAARALLFRALVFWLAVLALFVLAARLG